MLRGGLHDDAAHLGRAYIAMAGYCFDLLQILHLRV